MVAFISAVELRYFRCLTRGSLLAGIVYLALFLVFIASAPQGRLPPHVHEGAWASSSLALYQLGITLDLSAGLLLSGCVIALAALLFRRAPIRSASIAACGMGQLVSMLSAWTGLAGMSDLAVEYVQIVPDQQVALLLAFPDFQRLITTHFNAGALLWSIALMLVASIAWSLPAYPRWLIGVIAFSGLLLVAGGVGSLATGQQLPGVLRILPLLLLMVIFFAAARVSGGERRRLWLQSREMTRRLAGSHIDDNH